MPETFPEACGRRRKSLERRRREENNLWSALEGVPFDLRGNGNPDDGSRHVAFGCRKRFEADRKHPDFVQAVRIRKQLSGRDRMERLMQSIGMPCEIWPALADVRYQNPCREELQAMKLAFPGICVLASQIDKAAEARDEGAWKKYPEEVFLSTLSAFTRQLIARRQAEGRWAYKSDPWMNQRIRARIFRLGSLEFELKKDAVALHAGETELTDQTLKSSMLAWQEFAEAFLPERLHQKILAEPAELQTALQCLMTEAVLPDLPVF